MKQNPETSDANRAPRTENRSFAGEVPPVRYSARTRAALAVALAGVAVYCVVHAAWEPTLVALGIAAANALATWGVYLDDHGRDGSRYELAFRYVLLVTLLFWVTSSVVRLAHRFG